MSTSAAWARSGAMALTGRPDGPPLMVPERVVLGLDAAARVVGVDGAALLGERAALAGLSRQGDRSCGGATRLMQARGGWLALSLARPEDVESLPALLETSPVVDASSLVARRGAGDLVARAGLLGMPLARLGEARPPAPAGDPFGDLPVRAFDRGPAGPVAALEEVVVVDLSSLWAGPLCANLLGLAGATVVKVESLRRPDAARRGNPRLFDLLHAGHRSVALDFTTAAGRTALRSLVGRADVVIEASRRRALEQLGTVPGHSGRVWVSITGYGRCGPQRDRVAFGDDAAVAGGLVAWDDAGPNFCADAAADPATGLVAAAACLAALGTDRRWLLDVAMAGVAAHLAQGRAAPPTSEPVAPPRARPAIGEARPFGADTARVLAELYSR